MTTMLRFRSAVLVMALIFGIGQGATRLAAQTQSEGRPWELNAGDLQAVGLHLPSYMPKIGDLENYQKTVPSRQEILIEWDPHTGYDHPVFREQVAKHSLKHDFAVVQRKQNIKGDAQIGTLMLRELGSEVVGVTSAGEVRGLANGPTLLVREEAFHAPGESQQNRHEYIKSKESFWVGLPDDPKIDKLILLLVHPNEKARLEQIGVIDLTVKAAPK
jgi:hypothetical protein